MKRLALNNMFSCEFKCHNNLHSHYPHKWLFINVDKRKMRLLTFLYKTNLFCLYQLSKPYLREKCFQRMSNGIWVGPLFFEDLFSDIFMCFSLSYDLCLSSELCNSNERIIVFPLKQNWTHWKFDNLFSFDARQILQPYRIVLNVVGFLR